MGICPVGICPVGICPGVFVLESMKTTSEANKKTFAFFFYTLAVISNKKKSEITQTEMHGLSASGLMRF